MIKENGVVTRSDSSTAWVKTIRTEACEHCASKDSCGSSGSFEEMIITVKNTINVKTGDHVIVGLETSPMLLLTFFVYVFPIISLTIGAIIGNSIAPSFQKDPSFVSMVTGFLFFGLAVCLVKLKNNSLSKKKNLQPFLVRKRAVSVSKCTLP
ncbi:MAG: SoxR reducing system RseC family protein [Desulfobacula sp.]|nr:SoxR reducing system RseC family protein [Desulfobacula sp.]